MSALYPPSCFRSKTGIPAETISPLFLKISDIKDSYCQLYVKRLSEDYIINSTNREIVVTNEYAGNGYLTVYLVLQ